jgi:hypothetical protein
MVDILALGWPGPEAMIAIAALGLVAVIVIVIGRLTR